MPAQIPPPTPLGEQLRYWIAQAAKQMREEAGVRAEAIAIATTEGTYTVERFEKGQGIRYPNRMITGYATVLGIEDIRDIYQRALDLWREHGTKPITDPLGAVEDVARGALKDDAGTEEPPRPAPDEDEPETPDAATG